MSLFRAVGRAFLLNRLLRGSRRRSHRGYGYGYGRGRRRSSGFGMRGPFPTYSRRTRRGSQVSVSGCCLPIPFGLTVLSAAALHRATRRR